MRPKTWNNDFLKLRPKSIISTVQCTVYKYNVCLMSIRVKFIEEQ